MFQIGHPDLTLTRVTLNSTLESGRREFLGAAHGVSEKEASAAPRSGGWSILQCVEHVVIVEVRHLSWMLDGSVAAPPRDSEKELRLFTIIRNRFTKVQAPDAVLPQGRFRSLQDALAEFNAARDRSIEFVKQQGEGLYGIGVKHPHFGSLNGAELVRLIDGHASRHAGQIRELRGID